MMRWKSIVINIAALAFTVAFASMAAFAQTTTKIGILNDQSSIFTDLSGQGSVVAAKMAIRDSGIEKRGFKLDFAHFYAA
jgi:branched-chain amino acid transport system substrate-binding protein